MDNLKENELNTEPSAQTEQPGENAPDAVSGEEISAADTTDVQDTEPSEDETEDEDRGDEDDERRGGSIARIGIICAAALLTVVLLLGGWLVMLLRGPSDAAEEQAVLAMKENPLGRVILPLVLPAERIAEVERERAERDASENTELGVLCVSVNKSTEEEPAPPEADEDDKQDGNDGQGGGAEAVPEDDDGIELVHIKTESYQGTLLIVDDPKRIFVGVPDRYGEAVYGLTLRNMIRKYDAVAGMNAGGFEVIGDIQKGGVPMGFVIKDSKVAWGNGGVSKNICGFDAEGKLVVGTMTPNQAIAKGVVDAVSFGPALIIDGQRVNEGHWNGVQRNARTAIGQRADGAILLLVIEGRHIRSFGAYFSEVNDIFLEYGAVTATNLDGGYSTFMVYDEGGLDMHSYAYGERFLPTSILIRKK